MNETTDRTEETPDEPRLRWVQMAGVALAGGACDNGGLNPESAARLAALGRLVRESGAEIVLVAGDFFDREQTGDAAVNQALAEVATWPPVFVAPGAADPLSPLGPYSSLERARRGLDPLPDNCHVFGAEWETFFLPGRADVAVSGRGLSVGTPGGGTAAGADAPALGPRRDGVALSLALVPGAPAARDILAARYTYVAWGTAAAGEPVTDALGRIRAAGGGVWRGGLDPGGARELVPVPGE